MLMHVGGDCMKIEKISDNQIKCLLTKADLDSRHLSVNELAYGSEQANILFKEMTDQANRKYGFTIEDSPVMVEAIPLPNDSIVLFITKIDDPDELDSRFSKFSPSKDDLEYAAEMENKVKKQLSNKANEILGLINAFKKALTDDGTVDVSKLPEAVSDKDSSKDTGLSENAGEKKDMDNNIVMIYRFSSIDKLIALASVLSGKYDGVNSIYEEIDKTFILVLEKSDHTPEDFNRVCNIVCEYGDRIRNGEYSQAYFSEHGSAVLRSNALQELAGIKL